MSEAFFLIAKLHLGNSSARKLRFHPRGVLIIQTP
jgi:hypothetical protein